MVVFLIRRKSLPTECSGIQGTHFRDYYQSSNGLCHLSLAFDGGFCILEIVQLINQHFLAYINDKTQLIENINPERQQ